MTTTILNPLTTLEFYEHLCSFPEKYENRNLESYLSALLLLVQNEKDAALTVEKLLQLLDTAFVSEEIMFDNKWLQIRLPPGEDLNKSASDIQGKDFTIGVIKFQIAELHRMRDMPHTDEWNSLGITSETGNDWYNFDPFSNLECGARSFIDSEGEGTTQEFVCNWQTLGELLERGRIYE